MTTADALLAAVLAHPADDLPRLVYADWLDDTGTDPARAEFIRSQCGPSATKSDERANELLRDNRVRWEIPGLMRPTHQMFRRGFVAGIRTTADLFLAVADAIGGAAPVTALHLSHCVDRFDRLREVPWLPRVDELSLTNNVGLAGDWDAFLRVPLRHLKTLELRNCQLYPIDLAQMAASDGSFPELERLNLSGNPLGDDGLTNLATARFPALRELVLRSDMQQYIDSVHATGAAALARSDLMAGLTLLDLSGHHVGDAGLVALAGSAKVAALERLNLSANGIGEVESRGVEAVVESPHLGRLRFLHMGRNRIDAPAAAALADWPHLAAMERVDLSGCRIGPAARERLDRSPYRERFLIDADEKDEGEEWEGS